MTEISSLFERSWNTVLEQYKAAWKSSLIARGQTALGEYPTGFWSEYDLQTRLICEVRAMLPENVSVYSEVHLGKIFGKSLLQSHVLKLREKFRPDIVIHTNTEESFNLIAEVSCYPHTQQSAPQAKRTIENHLGKYILEARRLQDAFNKEVCESAYVCIIEDDLQDLTGKKTELMSSVKAMDKVHFLIDGVTHNEKQSWLQMRKKTVS